MLEHHLNKLLIALVFIFAATLVQADNSTCREVSLESKIVSKKEKVNLCFLKDDTYFISRNCMDLSCPFVQVLKKKGLSHSQLDRPGAITCKNLGGAIDSIIMNKSTKTFLRCVFKQDHSSISLNMLESWNGKHFTGPAESI